MYSLPLALLVLGTAVDTQAAFASPSSAAPQQVRKAIERGLVFVEKGGVAWLSQTKGGQCLSCHQGPMMLWTLNEARNLGFPVSQQHLDLITRRAVTRRVPADKEFGMDSLEFSYLTLAMSGSSVLPDAETTARLRSFGAHLVKVQDATGHWGTLGGGPKAENPNPLGATSVGTLWTALALSAAHDTIARQLKDAKQPMDESWVESRDKALRWAAESKAPAEPLTLAPHLLLEMRAGRADEVQAILKLLKAWQNADGGWSWKKDQPSDAFMTGQVLYVLRIAGVPTSDPTVPRALSFLVDTQREDGSWLVVHTTKRKNKSEIFTYAASAWATLGMMRCLSHEAKPAQAEKNPGE